MSKKTLDRIPARDGHELKRYATHHPACREWRECGDHVIVKTQRGEVVFPDRDMGTGLWCQVLKTCLKIGLAVLVFSIIVGALGL
jgi:hypothetical protein